MNEKISIVVPVYNVERYIKECVESLINQDYENIEIILVDDGSIDSSGIICDDYQKNHTNVFSYHKKNGGLSDARNYGIDKANGKYITFVDGDDMVEKDYISFMYKLIKKENVKISSCGIKKLYDNGTMKSDNFENIHKKFIGNEAEIYLNVIGYFNVSACNKLFKKDLFNTIKFPKGKKSEDWFVMYKIIEKSNEIFYDSTPKYIYRQRSGSITKSSQVNIDAINAAKEVYEYYLKNDVVRKYAGQSLAFAIIGVYNSYLTGNTLEKSKLKEYKKMVKNIKYITYKKLSRSRQIQLFLFKNCGLLYNIIFKQYNERRKKY